MNTHQLQQTAITTEQFSQLYGTHHARLFTSMLGITRNAEVAEDVTATAFTKALGKLYTFQARSSFYTWLHAIALNEYRHQWRSLRGVVTEPLDGYTESLEAAILDRAPAQLERSECCVRLRAALRRLSVTQRRTLVDHFIRKQPVIQIARRHRVPVGTVLSRIFKAKRLLRAAWGT